MLLMQGCKRAGGRRGFTLIEIMTVIAIIVVLVGLVVAIGTGVKQGSQIRATKVTLQNLQGMLEIMKTDYSITPDGEADTTVNNPPNNPAANMFPLAWSNGIVYKKNDVVLVGTTIYQCYLDLPFAGSAPATDTAHWTDGTSGKPPIDSTRYFLLTAQAEQKLNTQLNKMSNVSKSQMYSFRGQNVSLVYEVDDAFGAAIIYVAKGPSQAPFFVSPGPNGLYDASQYNTSPYTVTANNQDNIYSYDR